MSTKTVKLNANLHEELKKIAEKEGFVLQDLIEEKLNEVREEKGVYNFQPNDVEFNVNTQQFCLMLSPNQYQSLIILLKRLCLNEKINNITQLNMILESIKKLELMYKKHEDDVNEVITNEHIALDLVDSSLSAFYKTVLNAVNKAKDYPSTEESELVSELDLSQRIANIQDKVVNSTLNDDDLNIGIDELTKSLEEHHLTKNLFEQRTEDETKKLLDLFERKNYIGKMAEDFWKKLIEEDIKNGKCFSIKLNANDVEVCKLENIIRDSKEYTLLDRDLHFLYFRDEEMYFTGDFFKLLEKYNLNIDVNVVKMRVNAL